MHSSPAPAPQKKQANSLIGRLKVDIIFPRAIKTPYGQDYLYQTNVALVDIRWYWHQWREPIRHSVQIGMVNIMSGVFLETTKNALISVVCPPHQIDTIHVKQLDRKASIWCSVFRVTS
jgi:hypothetical protein